MIQLPSRNRRPCTAARSARTWRSTRGFAPERLEPRAYLSAQGLDAGFANSGIAFTSFSGPVTFASAMAVENDGKLVVVGTTEQIVNNPGFPPSQTIYGGDAIARYNTDGSLDMTFGNNGKIDTGLVNDHLGASSVAIQNDKILITDFNGLTRLNANGSIDTSFGMNGSVANPGGSQIGLQGDKILVSGGGLRRYNADGSLDTTFGNQGVVAGQGFGDFVIDAEGRIVVVTNSQILRFNSDGAVDTTFGKGGQVNVPGTAYFANTLAAGATWEDVAVVLLASDEYFSGISA